MAKSTSNTETRMTSVTVVSDLYYKFQEFNTRRNFPFQRLVNRALHLYMTDEGFRTEIENCSDLQVSGSLF